MASLSYSPLPLFVLLLLLIFSAATTGEDNSEIKLMKKKTTHVMFFYLRDIISGPEATALKVGQGPSQRPLLNFGDVMVFDDDLLEGPSPTSNVVGRAQGMYSISSRGEPAILMSMSLVFSEGKYNGSTLVVLGRNSFAQKVKELPVVGGTGKFRLALGYVLTSTHVFNTTIGETIARYDVYVVRP